MRLRHIEVFNAVYTLGSVSAAAKSLHITQPTASKILQHAEIQLGYKLFERVKGRLIPTVEATILYEDSLEIIEKVSSLNKLAKNISSVEQGKVRIASVVALGLEFIPKAIVAFRKKNLGITFEVQTHHSSNLTNELREQDKDIALAFSPEHEVGMHYKKIGQGEFVCIYSGNEFDHKPDKITLKDLENHPLISIENSGILANKIIQQIHNKGINVSPVITAQTYFMALNFVALGGGIAIVDEFTARSSGVKPVKYKPFNPPITFTVEAVHMEKKFPSKPCAEFLEYLKKTINAIKK
jgi:DNA-binding transcriptional LysR family regulator